MKHKTMKVWIWWLILISIMFNLNLLKWNSSKTYFFRDSFLNFTMSKNQIRCTDYPWNPHWRRSSRIFSIIIWQIILEFFLCFFLWLIFEKIWFWEWFFEIGRRLTPLNLTCFSTRLSSKVFFGFRCSKGRISLQAVNFSW